VYRRVARASAADGTTSVGGGWLTFKSESPEITRGFQIPDDVCQTLTMINLAERL
jgi:hypothetical protein